MTASKDEFDAIVIERIIPNLSPQEIVDLIGEETIVDAFTHRVNEILEE